ARLLASPAGVLVILPILVIGAGVVTMLLGRGATRDASDSMARRQLVSQAADVQHDVAFALDQAEPLLSSLRTLAAEADPIEDAAAVDEQEPLLSTLRTPAAAADPPEDAATRMRHLVIGRPAVANVATAFPRGILRRTYLHNATGELRVHESIVGDHGTARTN